MRWLIGYSTCEHTRAAFEARGHEVWTCDLRASDHPRHLQCDIWEVANDQWDAGIFHPDCTYLTCSAAWAFNDPNFEKYPEVGYHQRVKEGTLTGAARRDARDVAIENFKRLDALPYPTAIENPATSFVSKGHRPPDQVIQPYEYGENASKATGLWLDRLPPLIPTKRIPGRLVEWPKGSGKTRERWANQTDSGQNNLTPGVDRWLVRSLTYPGIASAFGEFWGAEPDPSFLELLEPEVA